jgi:hypothetical protein
VQRGQRREGVESGDDISLQSYRGDKIRTAMNDAVSRGQQFVIAEVMFHPIQHLPH